MVCLRAWRQGEKMGKSYKYVGITISLLGILVSTSTRVAGDDINNDRNNQFDFALIGDVPYSPTSGVSPTKIQVYPSTEYNMLIADINNHKKVAFSAHMGDIKADDTWCIGGNAKDLAGAPNVYVNN